jgi:hypothetical protein
MRSSTTSPRPVSSKTSLNERSSTPDSSSSRRLSSSSTASTRVSTNVSAVPTKFSPI